MNHLVNPAVGDEVWVTSPVLQSQLYYRTFDEVGIHVDSLEPDHTSPDFLDQMFRLFAGDGLFLLIPHRECDTLASTQALTAWDFS